MGDENCWLIFQDKVAHKVRELLAWSLGQHNIINYEELDVDNYKKTFTIRFKDGCKVTIDLNKEEGPTPPPEPPEV